ncbi:hypothetical protein GW17_00010467 [Ensete ventricosum]|nr:hypothetical protein GW17_00010467 [Ensete ventricosum]
MVVCHLATTSLSRCVVSLAHATVHTLTSTQYMVFNIQLTLITTNKCHYSYIATTTAIIDATIVTIVTVSSGNTIAACDQGKLIIAWLLHLMMLPLHTQSLPMTGLATTKVDTLNNIVANSKFPNLWLDRGPTTSAGPNGQPRNFDINLNLNGHSTTKSLPTFSLAETTLPHIINALEVYSAGSSRRRPPVAPTLITGQPPLLQGSKHAHIVQRVRQGRVQGNIEDIVDAKLQGQYDEKSVWKCVDIAMKCTSQGSHQRPTMAEVVMQLKERLELETPHDRTENSNMEVSDVSQSSAYVAKMLVAGIGPISKLMLGSLDFTLAALFYSDPKVFEMV